MPFIVIQPPTADEQLAAEGKKIVEAAYKLGRQLDIEGFLQAWIRGIRVIAETDNDGNYVGIAFAAMGDRWLFLDKAVSILFYSVKDRDGFLSFVKSIATAMGAGKVIYENKLIDKSPEAEVWEVREDYL